jgi:hypothetical protein
MTLSDAEIDVIASKFNDDNETLWEAEWNQLCAQSKEANALRADALRYRWLRDSNIRMDYTSDFPQGWLLLSPETRLLRSVHENFPECIKMTVHLLHVPDGGEPIWKDGGHFDFGANLDAAIDQARTDQARERG